MTSLAQKKCVPCEGGTAPLNSTEANVLLKQVRDWTLSDDAKKISKKFRFKDFVQAMEFANEIGRIAEEEGHHPNLGISWGMVTVDLTTHAIGGLSENDFIVAAKIDKLG